MQYLERLWGGLLASLQNSPFITIIVLIFFVFSIGYLISIVRGMRKTDKEIEDARDEDKEFHDLLTK